MWITNNGWVPQHPYQKREFKQHVITILHQLPRCGVFVWCWSVRCIFIRLLLIKRWVYLPRIHISFVGSSNKFSNFKNLKAAFFTNGVIIRNMFWLVAVAQCLTYSLREQVRTGHELTQRSSHPRYNVSDAFLQWTLFLLYMSLAITCWIPLRYV